MQPQGLARPVAARGHWIGLDVFPADCKITCLYKTGTGISRRQSANSREFLVSKEQRLINLHKVARFRHAKKFPGLDWLEKVPRL